MRITQDKYTCKICNSQFFHDSQAIKEHVQKIHRMTLPEYSFKFENANSVSVVPTPVPETEGKIVPHIVQEPHVSEEDFEIENNSAAADEDEESTELLITEVRSLGGQQDDVSQDVEPKENENQGQKSQEKPTKKWYQGCEFICRTCSDRNYEQKHCNNQWGQRVTDRKYTCRECAKSIMHYFTPIQYHLKSCHGMTMEEYGEKHEGQQPKNVQEEEVAGNSNDEKSPNTTETVHDVEEDKPWYNGNLFKCDKCQAVGNLDATPFPHAGRCGDDKLQLKRTSDNMYECRICAESVYHDYFAIGFHVRQQHKMNVDEYGRQHEQPKKLNIKDEPNVTNE